MSTPDGTEQEADAGHRGVRVVTDVPRQMVRIAYRDPEHICERLTLQAVHRLAEPSLRVGAGSPSRSSRWRPARGRGRTGHADREDCTPPGHGRRHSVLPRARSRLYELPVAGGTHEPAACGALRPRPGDPANRRRTAVPAGRLPERQGRRGRVARRRGCGHPTKAGDTPAVATLGRVRPAPARVRRIHRRPEWRGSQRVARAVARRRRARRLPRPLGDHVDLSSDVHDHDGLGVRIPLAAAVPEHACLLCHRGAARRSRTGTGARVAGPRAAGEAGDQRRRDWRCRSRSRPASSRTPSTCTRSSGSPGSPRSACSSPCPS